MSTVRIIPNDHYDTLQISVLAADGEYAVIEGLGRPDSVLGEAGRWVLPATDAEYAAFCEAMWQQGDDEEAI